MLTTQARVDGLRGAFTAPRTASSNGSLDPQDRVVLRGSEEVSVRPALPQQQPQSFSVGKMQEVLDGPFHAARAQTRQALADPRFQYRDGLSKDEYREQVMDWVHLLAEKGITQTGFPEAYGGRG